MDVCHMTTPTIELLDISAFKYAKVNTMDVSQLIKSDARFCTGQTSGQTPEI